jgi:ribosome-binding factor A
MFSKGSQEGRYSGSARRVSVLNKLFMKHITDLLSTGEYSSEFSGYGIEINRVQISPDYMALNVFWVARNAQNDEIVEKLLKKNAGFLRHELSSLRVMGVVPIIQFVKG